MKRFDVPERWRAGVAVVSDVTPDELERYFTDDERARIAGFKFDRRKKEWAASRLALKLLAIERGLCTDPRACTVASSFKRPTITLAGSATSEQVSISHSGAAGAVILDQRPIGIDLQEVREVNPRITKFFLNPDEVEAMQRVSIAHRLMHFWCMKEAIWKIDGGKFEGWYKGIHAEVVHEGPECLTFRYSRKSSSGKSETFALDDRYVLGIAWRSV